MEPWEWGGVLAGATGSSLLAWPLLPTLHCKLMRGPQRLTARKRGSGNMMSWHLSWDCQPADLRERSTCCLQATPNLSAFFVPVTQAD